MSAANIPVGEREAWSLRVAAKVFGIDYDVVRRAADTGELITFLPPTRSGARATQRRVTKKSMYSWVESYEV